MKKIIIFLLPIFFLMCSEAVKEEITTNQKNYIKEVDTQDAIKLVKEKFGEHNVFRIERGIEQIAKIWTKKDGTPEEFKEFCVTNFIISNDELQIVFEKISRNYEIINGRLHQIQVGLREPLDLADNKILDIDNMYGGYNPYANLNKDFFSNKIAHYIMLNFPFYTLEEKEKLGKEWSRKEWAYARLGDMFTSRIPAELQMKSTEILTQADAYISEYNIYMGSLIDSIGKKYFPKDMVLISHWGLRDELKANYSVPEDGFKKQKMIYEVMKNIIYQTIPTEVINKGTYEWNPSINKLYKAGKDVYHTKEPNTRYQHLLNNFKAQKAFDQYNAGYPNYIMRAFDKRMEMSQKQVEDLFIELCTSPLRKDVASLIEKRLERKLEPFDIWYDGFKARGNYTPEELDKLVSEKYPTVEAFQNDLYNILKKLGFSSEKADFISSRVQVDPSRGAGHAWGAEMRSDKARLRTRIPEGGMKYKGYNIAVHEFGHNVEQTISLQDVDYYILQGVPNTAFTEALAFLFQKRDLELLGLKDENPQKDHMMALDNFWSAYEIMGVSLLDMSVWKWMYENPEATPEQLKDAVISMAKEIWNKYYADIFGIQDQPILAIYSHMIDNPLYLSNYPVGHLIDFQIDEYLSDKDFAEEVERIYKQGRLIPQQWMMEAVGQKVSNQPLFNATKKALEVIK
jgi:hypothetical protein